jgi:hypothetical protein
VLYMHVTFIILSRDHGQLKFVCIALLNGT